MSILKILTRKTTTVLAVLCEQRAKEILAVVHIRNIGFCSDEVCGIKKDHEFKHVILYKSSFY